MSESGLSPEEMRAGHRAIVVDLGGAAEQWIHPNYVHHDPLIGETAGVSSRDAYVAAFESFRDPMPDQVTTAEEVLVDGCFTSARWRFRGRFTGEFRGLPPTNEIVEFWGLTMYRWEGGQVVEGWTLFDVTGFYAQIGVSAPQG